MSYPPADEPTAPDGPSKGHGDALQEAIDEPRAVDEPIGEIAAGPDGDDGGDGARA